MAIETINRSKLRNAAKKGKLFAKCSGRYTDDYAYDAAVNYGKMDDFKPVRFRNEGEPYGALGFVTFSASDFNTKSGCAYRDDRGVMHLIIHSNLSYEVEIRD